MNELNWAAPEEQWQKEIKPKVVAEVLEMRNALKVTSDQFPESQDTPEEVRKRPVLAWSTLMEYMNFPLDTPSDTAPYVMKMRRILEISEELNLPVFVPLNGFQWWDELPELYNWWDPDGSQTDPAFFARQDNPEDFKKRFIAGYDPENQWNVEWQSYRTPMKLNYRNWGGGGFRLAPPPNLMSHHKTARTYRSVQRERFRAIVQEIQKKQTEWEQENKSHLFAGLSIGTEVSLNASVKPSDEFEPYGYRGVQDLVCPAENPTCGSAFFSTKQTENSDLLPLPSSLLQARTEVVRTYLQENSIDAVRAGIPKNLVYTHVWSEAKEGEARYTNYAAASFNFYSQPGISLYGYAKDPLSLPDWKETLALTGFPSWGAVEYSAGQTGKEWRDGLETTLGNTIAPADLLVIYNWDGQKNTPSVPAIASFLQKDLPKRNCEVADILTKPTPLTTKSEDLTWQFSKVSATPFSSLTLHVQRGLVADPTKEDELTLSLSPDATKTALPDKLSHGIYAWYIEGEGCTEKTRSFSTPQVLYVPVSLPEDATPNWVRWLLHRM